MPRVLRYGATRRKHHAWSGAIPIGLMMAGLLGFVAFYPIRASHLASAAPAETVGLASVKPETVAAAKKPIRYEATIENWKRYRAANKAAE